MSSKPGQLKIIRGLDHEGDFVIQTDDKLSYGPSGPPVSAEGYEPILSEDFTAGKVPPDGWELNQTNLDYTWNNDSTDPLTEPYCGSCYHDNGTQDEWLITPSLNFSGYTRIYLHFWWYTSYYEAVHKDYHDLRFLGNLQLMALGLQIKDMLITNNI